MHNPIRRTAHAAVSKIVFPAILCMAVAACGGAQTSSSSTAAQTENTTAATTATATDDNSTAASSENAAMSGKAAVAMPDIHSAEAARAVLEDGGNAVDAAVAASFVLTVTLPEAGNIGGGGFMTLFMNGAPDFIDYRETAPAASNRDMYLDDSGAFISRRSQVGPLAAGVPGAVRGLADAHAKYGKLPWRRLVEPAVALARDGFVVPAALASRIDRKSEFYGDDVNFAKYYNATAGERFVQPELAATLQRIATVGPNEFYEGETARITAAYMESIGGLITEADLKNYKAVWRAPLTAEWKDRTVISAPPPSSGGIALLQLLQMKDVLSPNFDGVAHNSPQYVHLVAEMEKRVFADRAEYLGDPDFYEVPTEKLTARTYAETRAGEVNPDAISVTDDVKPGLYDQSFQTTHFSVLDHAGNAASVTTTLNASFGSGVVVEGAGYLLNNEMDDFSAKPGAPNLYGVVGAEANAIAPNKRMLSSMTPTVVLEDGKVAMVVGTPGGPTIFTSVFQAVVNHFEYDLDAEGAVSTGRFHHQLLPKDSIFFEKRINDADNVRAALEGMGYKISLRDGYGDVHAITIDDDGAVEAAHDPRGRGASFVFGKPEAAQTGGE